MVATQRETSVGIYPATPFEHMAAENGVAVEPRLITGPITGIDTSNGRFHVIAGQSRGSFGPGAEMREMVTVDTNRFNYQVLSQAGLGFDEFMRRYNEATGKRFQAMYHTSEVTILLQSR